MDEYKPGAFEPPGYGTKSIDKEWDTIIIGAGPNGLTAGAYLAKAGQKVLILEKRYETGGGLATDSLGTPFRHNLHATYMMLGELLPAYRDLNLQDRVNFIKPEPQISFNSKEKEPLVFYTDLEKTIKSMKKISEDDAETYETFYEDMEELCNEIVVPATYVPPMPPVEQTELLQETDLGQELLDISEMSPIDILDKYGFENPRIRGALLYIASFWEVDPESPGLGYMTPLYLQRMIDASLVQGGSHNLASEIQRRFIENGGKVLDWANVTDILVNNGKVQGVRLSSGEEFMTDCVISTANPEQTADFLPNEETPSELESVVDKWEWDEWSKFTLNFGIRGSPPKFSDEIKDANRSLISTIGYESEEDVLADTEKCMNGELPTPSGYITCTSLHDPTQVSDDPFGYELQSLRWESWAPYEIEGEDWDEVRTSYADKCLERLEEFAPNMSENKVLFKHAWSPLDHERRLVTMENGSIKHGAYVPTQMGFMRPSTELSDTRTPIEGLYLGGASVYPGGMITLGPAYQVARVVVEDYNLSKWWKPPQYVLNARKKGYIE